MLYQYPWYMRPRRRPYVWLREWRSFASITSRGSVSVASSIRRVARSVAHTPVVSRILLAQLVGPSPTTQPRHRSKRLTWSAANLESRHENTMRTPLLPAYKCS